MQTNHSFCLQPQRRNIITEGIITTCNSQLLGATREKVNTSFTVGLQKKCCRFVQRKTHKVLSEQLSIQGATNERGCVSEGAIKAGSSRFLFSTINSLVNPARAAVYATSVEVCEMFFKYFVKKKKKKKERTYNHISFGFKNCWKGGC